MHDTKRRIVCCRSAKRVCELLGFRVGHRKTDDLVPVAACSQHVDQRLDRFGVIADQDPRGSRAGLRAGGWRSGYLPADLVAVVRDGLDRTLSVVLCRKLGQHIKGLMIAVCTACTVEQGREFLDPAVLEKAYRLGTRGNGLSVAPVRILVVGEPVVAMLERIGRQVELSRLRLPKSGEIGQVAQDVGVGDGFGDLPVVVGGSAQRGDHPRCGRGVGPRPQGCCGQHRSRADLQQQFAIQIGESAHALGEFHRLARVPAPVGAIELHTPAECGAGAVVNQNPLWRSEFEPLRGRLEFVENRVEQRRVESVAGVQPVTPDTVGRQHCHRPFQILCGSGQDGVGAVVRGDRQTRELVGEALDTLGAGEHRHHPPTRGQTVEEPTAFGHQQHAVLEAEHAGDAGRRVLADAVAQHHVGFEAPRLPKAGQAHLHREQGGLRVGGLPQRLFAVWSVDIEYHVQQRLSEHVGDHCGAPIHGLGEHRLGLEQLPGHTGVLAALAGEQPRRLRRVVGFSADQTRRRSVVRERAE